jgi:hypothetical protein
MIDKIAKSVALGLLALETSLVTAYASKGGRYVLTVLKHEHPSLDEWTVSTYKEGKFSSCSNGHRSEESAFGYAEKAIKDARLIDGINYNCIPSKELSDAIWPYL